MSSKIPRYFWKIKLDFKKHRSNGANQGGVEKSKDRSIFPVSTISSYSRPPLLCMYRCMPSSAVLVIVHTSVLCNLSHSPAQGTYFNACAVKSSSPGDFEVKVCTGDVLVQIINSLFLTQYDCTWSVCFGFSFSSKPPRGSSFQAHTDVLHSFQQLHTISLQACFTVTGKQGPCTFLKKNSAHHLMHYMISFSALAVN